MRVVLRFREAIALKGYKQREVARMTGLRPNTINDLAKGEVDRLNLQQLVKIAEALNIKDIRELVYLEE